MRARFKDDTREEDKRIRKAREAKAKRQAKAAEETRDRAEAKAKKKAEIARLAAEASEKLDKTRQGQEPQRKHVLQREQRKSLPLRS